jgi:hypothetical protein
MGMATQLANCLAKMIWMDLEADIVLPSAPCQNAKEAVD